MKKGIFLLAFLGVLQLQAQTTLDIGIFNNPLNSNKLEVRIRPDADVVNGVYSAGVFTIRHPVSYGISLIAPSALNIPLFNYTLANQGTDGVYQYYSFSFVSPYVVNWSAGVSYPIAIIQISSGTTAGIGTFEIVNDPWTGANNGDVYQELNGLLSNGIIYQPSATAPLIPLPPDTVPPSVACTAAQTVGTNINVCTYTHSGNSWDAMGSDNYPGFIITYYLSGVTTGTAFTLANTAFNQGLTTVTAIIRDGAGLADTCAFTVTVNDLQPPSIAAPPPLAISPNTTSCAATNAALGSPTVSDNCGAPAISNNAPAQFQTGMTTVVWTATDAAGLTATASQTVTVQSNLAVSAVNASNTNICQGSTSDLSFAISGGTGPYTVVYTVNDNPVTISNYSSNQPIAVAPTFPSIYMVTSVTDALGCSVSPAGLSRVITVKPAPTLFALTPSTPVVCGGTLVAVSATGLLPNTANIIQYTFNGMPAAQTVVSNNLGAGTLLNGVYPHGTYTIAVSSVSVAGCTSTSVVSTIFEVDTALTDCLFHVQGKIRTEEGKGVKNVTVYLTDSLPGQPAMHHSTITDSSGTYRFLNAVPPGAYCLVRPYKNDNPLNGVTTFDLVLITKHLLGLQPFTSPYQIIAADANRSGSLTTFDIVEFRKLILGIYDFLPANTSWRFVDSSYVFPEPDNPLGTVFPETIAWDSTHADHPNTSFVAIKIGDVNNNVITALSPPVEERSSDHLLLDLQVDGADMVSAGQEIEVVIRPTERTAGFQFTLEWEGLELLHGNPGAGLRPEHFGWFDQALTCSWSETTGQEPLPDFTLRFRATKTGPISQKIYLSGRITPPEAYRFTAEGRAEKTGVQLRNVSTDIPVPDFQVYAIRPNPFSSAVFLPFYLSKQGVVTLTIWDETGRQVWNEEKTGAEGYQQFEIDGGYLPTGVLTCRIQTGSEVCWKKMVKL